MEEEGERQQADRLWGRDGDGLDGTGWGEEVAVFSTTSCHPSSFPGGEISIPHSCSLPKCSEFRKERAKPWQMHPLPPPHRCHCLFSAAQCRCHPPGHSAISAGSTHPENRCNQWNELLTCHSRSPRFLRSRFSAISFRRRISDSKLLVFPPPAPTTHLFGK